MDDIGENHGSGGQEEVGEISKGEMWGKQGHAAVVRRSTGPGASARKEGKNLTKKSSDHRKLILHSLRQISRAPRAPTSPKTTRSMFAALALLSSVAAAAAADPVGPTSPWGVHLAIGQEGGATSATVMWSTRAQVPASVVTVLTPTAANYTGEIIPFSDGGNVQTLHRVRLSGLTPATRYTYRVGDGSASGSTASSVFAFTTQPTDPASWQPTLAIFGDMGISSNALSTMPLLLADAASGAIDAVVHVGAFNACMHTMLRILLVHTHAHTHTPSLSPLPSLLAIGDSAYNLDSNGGATGDAFMCQIQPLATQVPYMICPGNQ
jgi:hypothetical protein